MFVDVLLQVEPMGGGLVECRSRDIVRIQAYGDGTVGMHVYVAMCGA